MLQAASHPGLVRAASLLHAAHGPCGVVHHVQAVLPAGGRVPQPARGGQETTSQPRAQLRTYGRMYCAEGSLVASL